MTYTSDQSITQPNANAQFWQQLAAPHPGPEAGPQPKPAKKPKSDFDHPLVLQQSSFWPQAILWSMLGGVSIGLVWANTAELEEAIPAQGKLEPQGTVKDVQAPSQGVVKAIYVKEGQRVKKGDKLLKLDPTVLTAQLESYQKVQQMLERENEYYRSQLQGNVNTAPPARVPQSIIALTRNRMALLNEAQYLRAQLSGDISGLSSDQQARLRYNQADLRTRSDAVNLQAQQLQQQLNQARVKYNTAQQTLAVNAQILGRVEPLAREGAISQIQFLKQQQEVTSNQSEVDQLVQEQGRIQFAIAETKSKVQNSIAVDGRDVMALLSANEQKIAEIDSQFTKAILENEKHISEMDSQIRQAAQMLKYSDIKAPADGAVFEMKPSAPGYVANAAEPLLKIVPQEDLIAKVTITNQDIGFLKPGMDVDVRVDSFPFSEFGDIKGTLVSIGSDALPPTQEKPYYSFPAKIKLKRQTINVKGQEIKLQSGMSLSVNVKTRSRKVIDIFTEQFKKGSESLKFVR
jgi:hemolysin D